MQLVYLWVEQYGQYKDSGFNFHPSYNFKYDKEENSLTCIQNEGVVEDFFSSSWMPYEIEDDDIGKISNLTVIVGDNGAGKSTLLDAIQYYVAQVERHQYITKSVRLREKKYVFIVLDNDDSLKLFSNINSEIVIKGDVEIETLFLKEVDTFNQIPNDTYYIHYDNLFENYKGSEIGRPGVQDISTIGLLKSDKRRREETIRSTKNEERLVVFFNEEMHRQIEFISKKKDTYKEYITFKLPERINLDVQRLDFIEEYIESKIEDDKVSKYLKQIYRYGKKFISEVERLNTYLLGHQNRIIDLYSGILLSLIFDLFMEKFEEDYAKEVEKLIGKVIDCPEYIRNRDEDRIIEFYGKFLIDLLKEIERNEKLSMRIKGEDYQSFIKYIQQYASELNSYKGYGALFEIPVENNTKGFSIYEFYNLYKKTARWFNYLNFSWPLSTGERTLLSLFARFYSTIKNGELKSYTNTRYRDINDICIMIDEADMTFHPRWQQMYVSTLLKFLTGLYKGYNIQLFITTHSPIMLSDIPSDYVIYLKKEEGKVNVLNRLETQTFGANIYTLYKDGFYFSENSDGIIGGLANDCIQKVREQLLSIEMQIKLCEELNDSYIKSIDEKLKECEKIIDYIGEPIIRTALKKKCSQIKSVIHKNEKLQGFIQQFEEMESSTQMDFLKYIISRKREE